MTKITTGNMRVDIERHDAIKRRLRANRITFTQIADELGITSVAITRVCQGYGRSERIERAIAGKLSTVPQELWPDRYDGHGNALPSHLTFGR